MKPLKRNLIAATLLLVLVPTSFTLWLIGTSSGLHWLLTKVILSNTLEIDTIEGNLINGLRLSGVRYHDAKVKISLDEALLNWRPAALLNSELRTEMLYLQRLRIELSPSDEAPLQLPDIHLPITVQLDDVQVNDLEIVRPGWPAIHINNASLRGKANRGGMMVQYLDISSTVAQLSLHGTLHPYADYWHDLELQWQLQLEGHPTLNGSGRLKGDLRQTTLQHQLTFPIRATTELKLFELLQKPHWQAALQIPKQPLNHIYETWPDEVVALTARGSGDLHHATIDGFTLDALKSRAHGKGALNWQEGFQWQADIESKRFDFPALWSLLQVNGPMIGVGVKGRLNGDLDHLSVHHATLRALDGTISGDAKVRWRDQLQWQTQLQAKQLELTQLWPLLALEGYGLPAGRADLTTALSGDAKGLNFTQMTLQALGATVRGDVALQWQPQLQWQLKLNGEGLDPAVWQAQRFAAWPGTLATQLEHQGRYVNNTLAGELNIQQLNGTLRGYPIELQTALARTPEQLEIKHFNLSSAESQVEAHGTLGEQMALQWQVDSPQLAQLHPDVSGALTLSGALSGAQAEPLLQFKVDGKKVSYAGQQIGSVQGNAAVQLFSWQQLLVDLYGRDLQLAGQTIDTLEFHARGDAADNQLKLQLGMAKLEALWRLNGAFDTERQQWQGEIRVADMNNPELGLWQLHTPAQLTASLDTLTLEPLCWYQQAAEICIEGGHQQQLWQGVLRGSELGLALLTPWLPRDMEIEGAATLHASVRYQPQQQPALSANARIDVGPGNISYPVVEDERSEWRFDAGEWQGALDEHGLRSQLQLELAGQDDIHASLTLPGYAPLTTPIAEQPLQGEVKASFSDLGLLNNLHIEVQGWQGHIELNGQIGGSVAQPALTGRLQLHDGSLQIPRLGLALKDIQFEAESAAIQGAGSDELNYQLQVRSGDGKIVAKGQTRLDPAAGWPTHITLSGEQFEVSHIPEARIVINPKLEMKMARHEIWIDGEVVVPRAHLQPKEFTRVAAPSNDVVILGAPESASPRWQIHNRVRLILGERVSLYGFGFEGTIGGNLMLIDDPGKATTASGELNVVEGRYRAYGQRLDVEQGRLLFAGGPITNPALDLRAVRHIQEVTAGIKVYGPLRQPQFELFSVPAMDQTDILAYLVLGMPLEQTTSGSDGAAMAQAALALGLSGGDLLARSIGDRFGIEEVRIESSDKGEQTSLVIGRYLSPRLYVGYGVGLIDSVNSFNVRYRLSKHWQLKAESGLDQSADIIYTIDR